MAAAVVHLELHTGDLSRASDYYARLCGWQAERIDTAHGSYQQLGLGGGMGGGIVQCGARRPVWLPYVQVGDVSSATSRAVELGATLLLAPREGPAGWRSVVSTPVGGELAFWQQKR